MSLISRAGSKCLDLAAQASDCLKSNPKAAKRHLQVIRQTTPALLDHIKKMEKELETKRDEFKQEERTLTGQINDKEAAKQRRRLEMNEVEVRKARTEALLQDARRDLDQARSNKRDAQKKKDDAIVGTTAGGAAAVVFGILFPPSLAVTVPAVAVIGGISIAEADREVDRCQDRVSSIERDVDNERRRIQEANSDIDRINREISELNAKQADLHAKLGQLRNEIDFMLEAINYFDSLHVSVAGGQQRTNTLQRVIQQANKYQVFKVLDSSGTINTVNSFNKAWRMVEDKILGGGEAGYLGITFSQAPQLD